MIRYTCCFCGGTHDATLVDVAAAHGIAAEDGALSLTDAEAMRDYGRDVCPSCVLRRSLLTFDRASTLPLTARYGGRIP